MEYILSRVYDKNVEIGNEVVTMQLYKGDSLKEVANTLKQEFIRDNGIVKFLEPNLSTKSEIISSALRLEYGNFTSTCVYHVFVTKGNKNVPWGEIDPDEYTDFILDMKKWLKNNIYSEDDPMGFTSTFGRKAVETKSGYTIA